MFYFVFGCNFSSTSSRGAYIWRGDLTEGFLRHQFGGGELIHGGAYFRNFTVQSTIDNSNLQWKSKKVRVIGSSKKIAGSKVKNVFYCTMADPIRWNGGLTE